MTLWGMALQEGMVLDVLRRASVVSSRTISYYLKQYSYEIVILCLPTFSFRGREGHQVFYFEFSKSIL